jgi:hypothetical protein
MLIENGIHEGLFDRFESVIIDDVVDQGGRVSSFINQLHFTLESTPFILRCWFDDMYQMLTKPNASRMEASLMCAGTEDELSVIVSLNVERESQLIEIHIDDDRRIDIKAPATFPIRKSQG